MTLAKNITLKNSSKKVTSFKKNDNREQKKPQKSRTHFSPKKSKTTRKDSTENQKKRSKKSVKNRLDDDRFQRWVPRCSPARIVLPVEKVRKPHLEPGSAGVLAVRRGEGGQQSSSHRNKNEKSPEFCFFNGLRMDFSGVIFCKVVEMFAN